MEQASTVIQIGSGASEWLSGAIGVFGAVLGSIVAVVGSEHASKRRRLEERKQRVASLSFSIYQKINFIYSDSITVRKTLRSGILAHTLKQIEIDRSGPERRPAGEVVVHHNSISSFIQSWANPPDEVKFTSDETWAAKDIAGVDLLNTMMMLDRKFNALIRSCVRYSDERQQVMSKIRVDSVQGFNVIMAGPPEDFKVHIASTNALDDMVLTMHQMAEESVVEAFAALRLLVEAEPRPFGTGVFEMKDPDGDVIRLGGLSKAKLPTRIANYR